MNHRKRAIDDARRRLDSAAEALNDLKAQTGAAGEPAAPPAAAKAAEAAQREALDAAREGLRKAAADLETERLRAAALTAELERLRAALAERPTLEDLAAARAQAEALSPERAAKLTSRVAELEEELLLLRAEHVRLETLRRKAESAVADSDATGRAVEETLRRELRGANQQLDRSAAEAGARDAKTAAEIQGMRRRLEQGLARLQRENEARDRERRDIKPDDVRILAKLDASQLELESTRAELDKARAVILSLQREAVVQRDAAMVREAALHQEAAVQREDPSARRQLELARAVILSLQREAVAQREAAIKREDVLQKEIDALRENPAGRAELEASRAEIQSLQRAAEAQSEAALKREAEVQREAALQREAAVKREAAVRAEAAVEREAGLQREAALKNEAAALRASALQHEAALQNEAAAQREAALQRETALQNEAAAQREAALQREAAAQTEADLQREAVILRAAEIQREEAAARAELKKAQEMILFLQHEAAVARDAAHIRAADTQKDESAAKGELEKAQATILSLQREAAVQRETALQRDIVLQGEIATLREAALLREAAVRMEDIAAAEAAAQQSAAPAPGKQAEPAGPIDFPAIEPTLDPGWNRLLRLLHPPLRSAYAYLRRLSSGSLPAGQRALLRLTGTSLSQALDSLSTIELALSEEPGPATGAPLLPSMQAVLASWETPFRQRGVILQRELPPGLPAVLFEAQSLSLLLHHVLRNALEALPKGGKLSVRAAVEPAGGVSVEFLDDGPGFPAAWLERRFEPFAVPRRGHAGLGLAALRCAMRRWGGDADASNRAGGRGARLVLSFASTAPPAPKAL